MSPGTIHNEEERQARLIAQWKESYFCLISLFLAPSTLMPLKAAIVTTNYRGASFMVGGFLLPFTVTSINSDAPSPD